MLVLKADGGVVVRGGVPQAAACDLDPLVLHLADSDLHHNLVARDVHRRLALLFNLISDALAQCLMKRVGASKEKSWLCTEQCLHR